MSGPTDKLDLDGLLSRWPAPARDEQAWEDRAEAIVKAALAASGQGSVSAALFEAPTLAAEPGEPQALVASAGENKMSQDSDQTGAAKQDAPPPSAVPSTVAPRSAERRKGSLKDIAARASQAGVASRPGSGIPAAPASRTGAPPPPSSVTSTPLPSGAASAGGALEDSGIVDLNAVKAKATPEQKAAADKAAPATAGLLDEAEEKPAAAAAAAAAPAKTATVTKLPEKKKGSGGLIAGVAIAALGVAAAFAIMKTRAPEPSPTATTETKPTPAQEAPKAPAQPAEQAQGSVPEAPAQPATPGEEPTETAPSGGGEKVAAAPAGGGVGAAQQAQQPTGGGETPATDPKAAEAEKKAEPAPVAQGTPPAPGDLKGAMEAAVGPDGVKKATPTAENAEPAAGRNQNIPEQPPQGSVQAAIRSVMPSVKACVAGADDVSRAQVTFASNGSVKSVSVTGWAASHGATGCIKAALQGANVGPFAKPSFTTGFPIRP